MRHLTPLLVIALAALTLAPAASAQAQAPAYSTLACTDLCVTTDQQASMGHPLDFRMASAGVPAGSEWFLMVGTSTGISTIQSGNFAYPVMLDSAVMLASGQIGSSGVFGTSIAVPSEPALLGLQFQAQLVVANGSDFALSYLYSIGPIIQDILH